MFKNRYFYISLPRSETLMNEYLIIGAGLQGEAIAYDILKFDINSRITIADKFLDKALKVRERLKSNRIDAAYADASNLEQMIGLMNGKNIAIGAASYEYNELLTKAAIVTKTNFIDLGGNNTIVAKQFALSEEAKKAGITVIADVGVAPGAFTTLAIHGVTLIGEVKYIHGAVGGLPQEPKGSLLYQKVFDDEGLINEYTEPVEILDNYQLKTIEPLTGIQKMVIDDRKFSDEKTFPGRKVTLEAAFTSGGSSTLAKTYDGKIESLWYKTLRYPGHWDKIRFLYDLGLFSKEKFGNTTLREITKQGINKMIQYDGEDMLIMKMCVGNDKEKVDIQLVDFYDKTTGHSAMQRTTGYSAAIVAEMIVDKTIRSKGTLKIEESVSPIRFINAWKERDIDLKTIRSERIE